MAQKEDQEERIATLEKRYLNSQREATTLRDLSDKYEQELKHKEDQVQLAQEKIKAVTEKLDISEQKLLDFASMPDIEDQLKDRMEALQQAQERQGTAEDRVQRLESQLDEKNADLLKMTQRLKMNEEHNQRLSSTVDKLLSGTVFFGEEQNLKVPFLALCSCNSTRRTHNNKGSLGPLCIFFFLLSKSYLKEGRTTQKGI